MKKTMVLSIILATVLALSGCASTNERKQSTENVGGSGSVTTPKSSSSSEKGFNDEEIKNLLSTTTYTWQDDSYYYAALIIKNASSWDCSLSANITFRDENGQVIGSDDESTYVFEKNTETCFVVKNDAEFASFDYTYDVEKPTSYYKAATTSLACETASTETKALLTFTNNGTEKISDIYYTVLFMQGENVVDSQWGILSDLSVNTSKTEEEYFWNSKRDFDSIKVYYTGLIDN